QCPYRELRLFVDLRQSYLAPSETFSQHRQIQQDPGGARGQIDAHFDVAQIGKAPFQGGSNIAHMQAGFLACSLDPMTGSNIRAAQAFNAVTRMPPKDSLPLTALRKLH